MTNPGPDDRTLDAPGAPADRSATSRTGVDATDSDPTVAAGADTSRDTTARVAEAGPVPPPESAADRLIAEYLGWIWRTNPVAATALGVDGHDGRLPDLTAEAFAAKAADEDAWLARFAALPDDELNPDERIDRDLAVSTLRGSQLERDWAVWRRNPDTYTAPALNGVFLLFLHGAGRDAGELAHAAVERLRATPALLAAGRANLDPALASPVLVRRARGQALAGVRYARELVAAEVADPALRADVAAAGEEAARAFEEYAAFLDDLEGRASGPFAIGEELYSALLREREGLGYGARELRERGRAAYEELAADLRRRAKEIAGHDDWRALLEELNADHPPTPEAMRDAYAEWTEKARAFCRERQLVTLPDGEECVVEPSPPFQRPVLAVASYMTPPAFRGGRTGHFFVPFPPDGTPADEVAKRLATNSYTSIPSISVHEAYPGHHWHLTWAGLQPRPLRKVVGTTYFVEGWALYAEDMMREEGFYTDLRHELCQVDLRLFRAARIVVDTSLHLGEMDVEEAVTFMSTKASLSEPTARTEVARYCSLPTQAASYLTGALEIRRIRDRWFAEGRGTLREFHDAIAGSGRMPLNLAERSVLLTGS
ncbi:MAG TPA: DUF885 domain-containing protein [Mycobacteriales bacterium]|jgi:uncharacterized protein (DUF885 family)|nr:DUF885 domain-containing protein [Mycobacteriales bacterium]